MCAFGLSHIDQVLAGQEGLSASLLGAGDTMLQHRAGVEEAARVLGGAVLHMQRMVGIRFFFSNFFFFFY